MKKLVFLPYDMDTALGINNEGALVFGYNLEDTDHLESGADVYNGQQSVLWNNLRDAFGPELKEMYQKLRSDGALSYAKVETMFEEHQALWPEAIFNDDAWFKYIDPLIEKGTAIYLPMLQGSKAEQRKWWLYHRFRYIDSKYNAGDSLNDFITLRGYAKADIKVVPYADIYPSVKYGSYLVQKRGSRGNECILECPLDNVSDTEIYVYDASLLSSVGDLSGLKVGLADFSKAIKLVDIKVGDASEGYSNGNLKELYLGNNTLLQTVDARNCVALSQAVDLSGCSNIEHIYFDGTIVTGVKLPTGGIIKTLHLPETVTNLEIINQKMINNFVVKSYTNIGTLRLEHVSEAVDSKSIIRAIAAGSRVRLIGINWTTETFGEASALYDVLDTMRGLDQNGNNVDTAQVSGTFLVDSLTGAQMAEMQDRYPNITVRYNHLTSYLYFYNEDGTKLLYTCPVSNGGDGMYVGSEPTKTSTAQYEYSFVGWSKTVGGSVDADALIRVEANRSVYAVFSATVRTYTVRFLDGSTVLESHTNIPYGGDAAYSAGIPVKSGVDDPEDYVFSEWVPSPLGITGDTDCVAQYRFLGSVSRKLLSGTLKGIVVNDTVTQIGAYAMSGLPDVTGINFSKLTKVDSNGCKGMKALNSINLPVCTKVSEYAFQYAGTNNAEGFDAYLPSVNSTVGTHCFHYSNVKIAKLPKATALGQSSFESCNKLKIVYLKDVNYITDYAFRSSSQLKAVVIAKVSPPNLYSIGFDGSTIKSGNGYVYVPRDSVNTYKTATNWSNFAEKIRALEDYTVDGTIDGDLDETKI